MLQGNDNFNQIDSTLSLLQEMLREAVSNNLLGPERVAVRKGMPPAARTQSVLPGTRGDGAKLPALL